MCPLVEDKDKVEAQGRDRGVRAARRPRSSHGLRLGLLHGQMPSTEKEAVDGARSAPARLDVLVATTVIEVGVDVPNATVMVVEDADRFGLSQLHQLRGRVGRGGDRVVLLPARRPDAPPTARRAWRRWPQSTDGFELAEKDLEIRGAGEVFGERQSGFSDLKLGRIPQRRGDRDRGARASPRRSSTPTPTSRSTRSSARRSQDLLGDAVDFLFKSVMPRRAGCG